MRILVLDAERGFGSAPSIAKALASLHEVESFPYSKRTVPLRAKKGKTSISQRLTALSVMGVSQVTSLPRTVLGDRALLKHLESHRYDMILILCVGKVPPDVVRAAKQRSGALIVGWYMDAIVNLGGAEFVHAPFDKLFFKDPVIVSRFRDGLGSDVYDYLPQGFSSEVLRPVVASDAELRSAPDVLTYGNGYAFRAKIMEPLLKQADLSVHLHGVPQRRTDPNLRSLYRRPIFGAEKASKVAAARICLNSNHYGEIGGANVRTFELAGMGGFQLTDGPAVSKYFEPGKELATFQGPHDLVEKVRFYLDRPDERRRIARAGLERAWTEHTYRHRVQKMFESIPALRGEAGFPLPELPADPH